MCFFVFVCVCEFWFRVCAFVCFFPFFFQSSANFKFRDFFFRFVFSFSSVCPTVFIVNSVFWVRVQNVECVSYLRFYFIFLFVFIFIVLFECVFYSLSFECICRVRVVCVHSSSMNFGCQISSAFSLNSSAFSYFWVRSLSACKNQCIECAWEWIECVPSSFSRVLSAWVRRFILSSANSQTNACFSSPRFLVHSSAFECVWALRATKPRTEPVFLSYCRVRVRVWLRAPFIVP